MEKMDIKILIIEDVDIFTNLLITNLNLLNYHNIISVDTLDNIFEILSNENPSIIIMDTHIKKDMGYKICSQIRKINNSIGIIGMSDLDYQYEWLQNGADFFLFKNNILKKDILEKHINLIIEKYKFKK